MSVILSWGMLVLLLLYKYAVIIVCKRFKVGI